MDTIVSSVAENIIIETARAKQLAEQGFTIFPLLNEAQTKRLSTYYFDFQKEEPSHFYSSSHSKDFSFRKKTSDFIKEVVGHQLPTVLKNYRLLGGAFLVKPPNGKGILHPHQDWNIVDESKSRSFNLWIPLTDVTVENGAVFSLPGSHAKMKSYRGPGTPSLFKTIEQQIWNELTPLPMTSGEGLFYDHALLHGSPINETDKIRLGIVCGIIPTEADMQLNFLKDGRVETYKADENFFIEKDQMNGPEGLEFIGTATSQQLPLTLEEYQSIFLNRKQAKQNWFAKLFG